MTARWTVARPHGGRLVLLDEEGEIAALVESPGMAARPSLDVRDTEGAPLMSLRRFTEVERALTALGPGGREVARFVPRIDQGRMVVDVRDATNASLGRMVVAESGPTVEVEEASGQRMATLITTDRSHAGLIDDEWSIEAEVDADEHLVMALPLAAKVMFGRSSPQPLR